MALLKGDDETKMSAVEDTRRSKSTVGINFLNYFYNLGFSFRPYKSKDWVVHKRECCGGNEELLFVWNRSIVKNWQYIIWITWKDCVWRLLPIKGEGYCGMRFLSHFRCRMHEIRLYISRVYICMRSVTT